MPVDDIAGSLFGSIFRFVGWIFIEIFIEILVKGLGYMVCRPFKKINVDSITALVVGAVAWLVLVVIVVTLNAQVSNHMQVDTCLDSGGSYNKQSQVCEYE